MIRKNSWVRINNKESVAIVGGGTGGVLTVLELAAADFHPTLIREGEHLFEGGSKAAARKHCRRYGQLHRQTFRTRTARNYPEIL